MGNLGIAMQRNKVNDYFLYNNSLFLIFFLHKYELTIQST